LSIFGWNISWTTLLNRCHCCIIDKLWFNIYSLLARRWSRTRNIGVKVLVWVL